MIGLAPALVAATPSKPNIIVIFSDDMNDSHLGTFRLG